MCVLFCFILCRYSGGRTADDIINFINGKAGQELYYHPLFMLLMSHLSTVYILGMLCNVTMYIQKCENLP